MINYNKNKLINECLAKYYETFARTLDTADFVPTAYNDKITAYIFKNMKKAFKKVDKEDKCFQKTAKKKYEQKKKQENARVKAEKKRQKHERALAEKKSKKSKKGGK